MMKIKYNAPVILTYALACICLLVILKKDFVLKYFTSPSGMIFDSPVFYLKLITYIAGHDGWRHLTSNLTIILLIGPLIEEKYGSIKLMEMMVVTAVITGVLNSLLFSSSIMGGSGIAFMLILLGSFSNIRAREIPLTFIVIALLFMGNELVSGFKIDRISQFSHLAGGFIGAGYGFVRKRN